MKKNIFIFTRCVWTFINFRSHLVRKIDHKKYNITVCMDFDGQSKTDLKKKYNNLNFKDIKFLNKNQKIINNFKIISQIISIFLNNKIHIVHNFTARPIVFVSFVSLFFRNIRLINTITGLGNNFFQNKIFFSFIYNLIFLIGDKTIFQNRLDKKIIFKNLKNYINASIIYPTVKFKKKNLIKKTNYSNIIFTMHCRMIEQKGVFEYIEAAKYVKKKVNKKCSFYLIGDPDLNNPTSIDLIYLKKLNNSNAVKYIRHQKNIDSFVSNSDVIVLPSYGEGLPASLLEALFFKKAIITTNVNGCSEMVINNSNGFLVRPKSSSDLIVAIKKIIDNPKLINKFGKKSYNLYKKKFSNNQIKKYLNIYKLLCKKN